MLKRERPDPKTGPSATDEVAGDNNSYFKQGIYALSIKGEDFLMSASKKISIDKVRRIQEDEKTKRIIISAENGGHEIELNITAEELHKIESFMVVRNFNAAVAKIHAEKKAQAKSA